MKQSRAELIADISIHVRELLSEVRTSAEYTRDGSRGSSRHRQRLPGLLLQLVTALPPGGKDSNGRAGKPGSRPPVNETAHHALGDIAHGWAVKGGWQPGVFNLRARLRRAANRPRALREGGVVDALHEIRRLALIVDPECTAEAASSLRAYVGLAKTALAYDAPVATLRDVACPYCGGRLRVAADASSDVWCSSPACKDDRGHRHTWPRRSWGLLLADGGPRGA